MKSTVFRLLPIIALAVLMATLTTVVVFLPVSLVGGQAQVVLGVGVAGGERVAEIDLGL